MVDVDAVSRYVQHWSIIRKLFLGTLRVDSSSVLIVNAACLAFLCIYASFLQKDIAPGCYCGKVAEDHNICCADVNTPDKVCIPYTDVCAFQCSKGLSTKYTNFECHEALWNPIAMNSKCIVVQLVRYQCKQDCWRNCVRYKKREHEKPFETKGIFTVHSILASSIHVCNPHTAKQTTQSLTSDIRTY